MCRRAVLLEDVSTGQAKFINKELAALLFTNTTSQMTSITSNQLTVNDVICDVVFVNNNAANSLLMNFDCPLDTSSSKTARATENWLQTNCPDFIAKDQWPPNLPDLNPLDYHVWGNVGGLSQAPPETENDRRTEGSPAGDLGQPIPQGPIDKAVKEFSKRLN